MKKLVSYPEKREFLTDLIVSLTKEVYPEDHTMLSDVLDMVEDLTKAEPFEEFIDGLLGWYFWSKTERMAKRFILTNMLNDLGEFGKNRDKPCFYPRTAVYQRFFKP